MTPESKIEQHIKQIDERIRQSARQLNGKAVQPLLYSEEKERMNVIKNKTDDPYFSEKLQESIDYLRNPLKNYLNGFKDILQIKAFVELTPNNEIIDNTKQATEDVLGYGLKKLDYLVDFSNKNNYKINLQRDPNFMDKYIRNSFTEEEAEEFFSFSDEGEIKADILSEYVNSLETQAVNQENLEKIDEYRKELENLREQKMYRIFG